MGCNMYIYIGFSTPSCEKIGSKLIKMWTGKKYSHVYLRFESNKVPSTVYHAANGMVHFITLENFLKKNKTIVEYKIEIDDVKRIEFLINCMKLSGEKYGYIELIKIFTSDIIHQLSGKNIQFNNSRGYICSELVGVMLTKLFNIKYKKPTYLLKPQDIEEALKSVINI